MAAELGVQGFLLLVHSLVPVLFAPFRVFSASLRNQWYKSEQ